MHRTTPRRAGAVRRAVVAVGATAAAVLATVAAGPAVAAAPAAAHVQVQGRLATVASSGMPSGWKGWTVQASVTGSGVVAQATAKANGRFTVDVPDAIPADGIVYFIAHAPKDKAHPLAPPATLATVATAIPGGNRVTLNERTTVAAAWAMAQFVSNTGIDGSAPGLRNSAGMAANLANPKTGNLAKVLTTSPNGNETSTLKEFRSLTAAVASCVVDPFGTSLLPNGACQEIINIGAKAQDPADPVDSFRALAEIARNPSVARPVRLYLLSTKTAVAGATLSIPPVAWTVALRFNGDGKSLDGPGNFAVDAQGNLWVNNNYEYNKSPDAYVCGSDDMFKFSPTGDFTKYTGGGLSGAGLGILLNHSQDKLWISNFGFASPPTPDGCTEAEQPPHNTVTIFEPGSNAFMTGSPFDTGSTSWPQGMAEDPENNVWTANCQNNTVTRWAGGDPTKGSAVTSADGLNVTMAFDMAANKNGVFVSGMLNDSVQMVSFDGKDVSGPGPNSKVFNNPMGVTSAADGTIWVANSANVVLPCDNAAVKTPESLGEMTGGVSDATFDGRGEATGTTNPYVGSVAMVSPDGKKAKQFTGGGVTMAWGINTDGDGNVWVANFAGKRLSEFCGVDASTCPVGSQTTGAAISPARTGFFFDGLVRNTGVVVDQSGNVWLANNWIEKANIKYNPGGHEIVAYLGIAAPKAHPATSTPTPTPTPTETSSSPERPVIVQTDFAGPATPSSLVLAGGVGVLVLAAGALGGAARSSRARRH